MFLAGIAFGSLTVKNDCIAFISETKSSTNLYSFASGVQHFAHPTVRIVSIMATSNQYQFAQILNNMSCSLFASLTSSNEVSQLTQELTNQGRRAYSVGTYIQARKAFGDSVITSVLTNWANAFVNLVENGTAASNLQGGMLQNYVKLDAINEIVPKKALDRISFFEQRIMKGWDVLTNISRNLSFVIDGGVWADPSLCPPGNVSYVTPNFTLICARCPENTYTARSGSWECTPCDLGAWSAAGSTSCQKESSYAVPLVAIIIVIIVACLITMQLLFSGFKYLRYHQNIRYAPKRNPVTIVYCAMAWADDQPDIPTQDSRDLIQLFCSIIKSQCQKHYGYATKSLADSMVVAFDAPISALNFCLDLQVALMEVKYHEKLLTFGCTAPRIDTLTGRKIFYGIRCQTCVHSGDVHFSETNGFIEYSGAVVQYAQHLASLANGGQILFTQAVHDTVLEHLNDLAVPVRVRSEGTYHTPDGLSVMQIYSALSVSLLERAFPKLVLDVGPAEGGSGNSLHELQERARRSFPMAGIRLDTLMAEVRYGTSSSYTEASIKIIRMLLFELATEESFKKSKKKSQTLDRTNPMITWKQMTRVLTKVKCEYAELMMYTATVRLFEDSTI
eukprot:PhF_6_TR12632/c0_g1_i1/m.20006